MSGIFILPILQSHDEDQMRTPGSPPPHTIDSEVFAHELLVGPQPYFPAQDAAGDAAVSESAEPTDQQ